MVSTLNTYRRFLNSSDRRAIEAEVEQLEAELRGEERAELRDVKQRRVEILKKRVARFVHADERREVLSHQLATIEDVLRLTHEQAISLRDAESVTRQLESLTAEVDATEETVREMDKFMQVTDELSSATAAAEPVRVR